MLAVSAEGVRSRPASKVDAAIGEETSGELEGGRQETSRTNGMARAGVRRIIPMHLP